jgi:hypothetical protein
MPPPAQLGLVWLRLAFLHTSSTLLLQTAGTEPWFALMEVPARPTCPRPTSHSSGAAHHTHTHRSYRHTATALRNSTRSCYNIHTTPRHHNAPIPSARHTRKALDSHQHNDMPPQHPPAGISPAGTAGNTPPRHLRNSKLGGKGPQDCAHTLRIWRHQVRLHRTCARPPAWHTCTISTAHTCKMQAWTHPCQKRDWRCSE